MTHTEKNRGRLTADEIRRGFDTSEWGTKFPPILSVQQAAALAGVPPGTIYDWSSQGDLRGCAARKGKRLRIWRDRFIAWLFEGVDNE